MKRGAILVSLILRLLSVLARDGPLCSSLFYSNFPAHLLFDIHAHAFGRSIGLGRLKSGGDLIGSATSNKPHSSRSLSAAFTSPNSIHDRYAPVLAVQTRALVSLARESKDT